MIVMTRRTVAMAALLASGLAVAVPAPLSAQQDARPELVVALPLLPPSIEPFSAMANTPSAWNMIYNTFDALVDINPEDGTTLIPGLARSWRQIDDTTVEMKIRQDVLFHDGTPLTVEDVAFSLGPERALSEDAPGHAQKKAFLPTVSGVEIVDDETVRLKLVAPTPAILPDLAFASQIIKKDAYLAAEGWDAWGLAPIGTGPYRLAEFRPDEYVRLEAFDDYWQDRPRQAPSPFGSCQKNRFALPVLSPATST